MDSTTLFSVYLCGHHTIELIDNLDDRKYFICYHLGVCDELGCALTEVSWFKEQLEPVTADESMCVDEMNVQFRDLMADAKAVIAAYRSIKRVDPVVVEFALPLLTANLLLTADYEEALREYLDVSLQGALKRCARMSLNNTSGRPLFDFCHEMMHEHLDGIIAKVDELTRFVNALQRESWAKMVQNLRTPAVVCFQPERSDYDRFFGQDELLMLKQAGSDGLAILDSHVSDTPIAAITDIVARTRASPLLASDVFDLSSPSLPHDDIDLLLEKLEAEFKAPKLRLRKNAINGKPALKRLAARNLRVDTLKAKNLSRAAVRLRAISPQ